MRSYKAYAAGTTLESVTLGAAMVMSQLLLQRPHGSSKLKEHISCLERRMKLWKEGKLDELVWEVTAIQNRLRTKRQPTGSTNVACEFANLIFGGKVREALELLSEKGRGRVLLPDELVPNKDGQTSVMSLLKSKHPQAMPLNTTAVDLNSDQPPQIQPVVYDRIDAKLIKCSTLSTIGSICVGERIEIRVLKYKVQRTTAYAATTPTVSTVFHSKPRCHANMATLDTPTCSTCSERLFFSWLSFTQSLMDVGVLIWRVIIEASVSEPHTSVFNCNFS